ncbi:acyltransferase [Bradyrhizobium sp. ISRA442]|uniref:acyltransferase n=1 Tax=Bradyrhizobium sp. ISRA442 TaxID=2866197 RepID=UPI00311B1730
MTPLGRATEALIQRWRRWRLRLLFGVDLPTDCRIGRHVTLSGRISIGRKVSLDDDVRLMGSISIGSNSTIHRQTELTGNIVIGDDCVVGPFSVLSTAGGASIEIGDDCYINSYNVIGANAGVHIGGHCIFAAFVHITDASHGIDDLETATKHAPALASPVRIGENVWLGSGAMITMGSTIGDHAVVGAKSLVRSALPERSISFGIPAQIHRLRE